jgi:hypothetical protein
MRTSVPDVGVDRARIDRDCEQPWCPERSCSPAELGSKDGHGELGDAVCRHASRVAQGVVPPSRVCKAEKASERGRR